VLGGRQRDRLGTVTAFRIDTRLPARQARANRSSVRRISSFIASLAAAHDQRGLPNGMPRSTSSEPRSADLLDDLDQLIQLVTLPACEGNELLRALDDGAAFGGPGNRDSAPAPELE
jgi:hypothetical protein